MVKRSKQMFVECLTIQRTFDQNITSTSSVSCYVIVMHLTLKSNLFSFFLSFFFHRYNAIGMLSPLTLL